MDSLDLCTNWGWRSYRDFTYSRFPSFSSTSWVPIFYGVIDENNVINENSLSKMLHEADSFTTKLKNNVSGSDLLNDFRWLNNFETLLCANCNLIPLNLKRLRYTGYVMVIYNTVLMHALLNGLLPISLTSCVPIFASIASNYIDSSTIIMLDIFEFGQIFLSITIFGTFIALKARINSNVEGMTIIKNDCRVFELIFIFMEFFLSDDWFETGIDRAQPFSAVRRAHSRVLCCANAVCCERHAALCSERYAWKLELFSVIALVSLSYRFCSALFWAPCLVLYALKSPSSVLSYSAGQDTL